MAYNAGGQYDSMGRGYNQDPGNYGPPAGMNRQQGPNDGWHQNGNGNGGGGGGGGDPRYGHPGPQNVHQQPRANPNDYADYYDDVGSMGESFDNLSVQGSNQYNNPQARPPGNYPPRNQSSNQGPRMGGPPNQQRPNQQLPNQQRPNQPPYNYNSGQGGPPNRPNDQQPQRGPGGYPNGPESWQGRSGTPQGRGMPPNGGMQGPRGPPGRGGGGGFRGPPRPPGSQPPQFNRPRPPPAGNNYRGPEQQNQNWNGGPQQGYDNYDPGSRQLADTGRSQTMPSYSTGGGMPSHTDTSGYGHFPAGRGAPQPQGYNGQYGQSHYDQQPRQFDSTRGSVGDVLDLYAYDESYNNNYRPEQTNMPMNNSPQAGGQQSNMPMNNYSQGGGGQPNPSYYNQQQEHPNGGVAHRSKSQPNLRPEGPYNGYPPANSQPVPPMPYGYDQPGNGGTPPPWGNTPSPGGFNGGANRSSNSDQASIKSSISTSRPPPQRNYSNAQSSDVSGGSSYQQGQPQPAPKGSDDPDALPEHPAPVRPGLTADNGPKSQMPYPNRPDSAGVNPMVAQGKMSIHDSGQVTFDMLNLLRNEIASRPANQPANPSIQLRFAKRLVEASFVLVNDADPRSAKRSRENFTLEAHKIIKKLSSGTHPHPEAMFYLANCYGDGALGLEVDHDRAFTLYQSAAKLNHPPSAYRTAVCCEIGAGTKKEPQKAIQWYRKAATLGDTAAMYKTGMILHKGLLGQPRNDREAIVWLKRAAEQADEENPHALHQLGILYESADGNSSLLRDLNYAQELFTKAADLGYPPSQYRLGTAYAYGLIGCPVDAKLSITWYSRAAAAGDAESELALAGWYLTGAEGVLEQNDTEAYLWSRKAAEQGLAKAEFAVGHLTELGIGLDGRGSDEEAKNWYFRAAGQGHAKAKERLDEMRRGAPKKGRERLSRHNKAKDDADCIVM